MTVLGRLSIFTSQGVEEFPYLSKMDTSANTLIDAGRPFSLIDPVIAEMAFLRHTFFRIKLHHSKRTDLKTGFTSHTSLWIDKNDAIRSLADCVDGASLFTWRSGTMETTSRIIGEFHSSIYLLNSLGSNPDPTRSFRWIVFLFAGQLTGAASPTDLLIDDHRKSSGHDSTSLLASGEIRQRRALRLVAPMAGSHVAGSLSVSRLIFESLHPCSGESFSGNHQAC
jgi:hypothetical protein